MTSLCIVVPVFNEEATLGKLVAEVHGALADQRDLGYRIIFVDDGSRDGSWREIAALHAADPRQIQAVRLRKNFGKSDALSLGFASADADVIVTMDADLQDDPAEIPRLIAKLDEGFDLVSGWKENRRDPIGKTLPSRLFNLVTAKLTSVRMRDFNSGLKAYRADVVKAIPLYGELHRYIPVLAAHMGFRVAEIPVNHRPRTHGVSKYGFERYVRGFLDLLTVLATTRYLRRPGHLFGGVGLVIGLVGLVSLTYLSLIWFLNLGAIGNRPLLLFGVLCVLLSAQLISLGIVAELSLSQSRSRPSDLQVMQTLGSSDASANATESRTGTGG